jgi:predicted nucleotidyltransferase component of viral defense system
MTVGKRRPIDPESARQMSDLGHICFIQAMTQAMPLQSEQVAFHGGTSLHLSWKSPRFSEDLDFLLSRKLKPKMGKLMRKVEDRMRQILKSHDPDLDVEITDKTRDGSNLLNYRVTVSSAAVIGVVKVKAEFWQVESDYLKSYDTRFAYPLKNGDVVTSVSQPVPAATLEAAYADKLTAFATRRHLKWRDVFDLWWIDQQISVNPEEMADRFLHHVQAFETYDGLPPAQALRKFLDRKPEDIASEADPDLKKWLPKSLWESLSGKGVDEIIAHTRAAILDIVNVIEDRENTPAEEEECYAPEP